MDNISYKELCKLGLISIVNIEVERNKITSSLISPQKDKRKSIIEEWYKLNNIKSEADFNLLLNKYQLDKNEFEEFILNKWKWENWCLEFFKDELESYYLKRKDSLDKVSYYLIRVKEKGLAEELFLRIKEEDASFSDLASNFSEGVERKSGGLIGPIPINNAHPEIVKLLNLRCINKLWEPIQIENWWVIIRFEKVISSTLDSKLKQKLALELGEAYLKTNSGGNLE